MNSELTVKPNDIEHSNTNCININNKHLNNFNVPSSISSLKYVDYLDLIVDKRIDKSIICITNTVDRSSQTIKTQIYDIMTSTTELDDTIEHKDEMTDAVDILVEELDSNHQEVTIKINDELEKQNIDEKIENEDKIEEDTIDVTDVKLRHKVPPKRPPPPDLNIRPNSVKVTAPIIRSSTIIGDNDAKNKRAAYKKVKQHFSLSEKMYIFKSNTVDFSKKIKKQISSKDLPFHGHQVASKKQKNKQKPTDMTDGQDCTDEIVPQETSLVMSSPKEKSIENGSATYSPPQRTYKSFNGKSIQEMLSKNNSVFETYRIIDKLKAVASDDADDLFTVTTNINSVIQELSMVFLKTAQRQMRDKLKRCNESLSQCLDLDSPGLSLSCQREMESHRKWKKACCQEKVYSINWLPGWKHLRIVEDNNSGLQYIVLKNSMSQYWMNLCSSKTIKSVARKWIAIPMTKINTLRNEIEYINIMKQNGINSNFIDIYRCILRIVLLLSLIRFYENNPDNFSRKIDANNILLITSDCGFMTIFHDEFNSKKEELPTEIFKSECISELPQELELLEAELYEKIKPIFETNETLNLMISSLWPLDTLLFLIIDNVFKRAYETGLVKHLDSDSNSDNESAQHEEEDDDEEEVVEVLAEQQDPTVEKQKDSSDEDYNINRNKDNIESEVKIIENHTVE